MVDPDDKLPAADYGERLDELDRGGHFPALEVPDLLLEDLLATLS